MKEKTKTCQDCARRIVGFTDNLNYCFVKKVEVKDNDTACDKIIVGWPSLD